MRAFDVLRTHELLDLYGLLVGLERAGCDARDAADFAADSLGCYAVAPPDLAGLALARRCSADEARRLILACLGSAGLPLTAATLDEARDKWRFAEISVILLEPATDASRIERLQEVYAAYGFPEDMADCCIYGGGSADPIAAARALTRSMARRFGVT